MIRNQAVFCLITVAIVLLLSGPGRAGPPQVPELPPGDRTGAGYLEIHSARTEFNEAVAYKTKDGAGTVVLLTEKPVDIERLKTKVKNLGTWTGFVNHLMITFDSKGGPAYFSLWVKKDSTSVNSPGFLVKGQAAIKGEAIQGRAAMKAPEKQFGTEYFFDVSFKAKIVSP